MTLNNSQSHIKIQSVGSNLRNVQKPARIGKVDICTPSTGVCCGQVVIVFSRAFYKELTLSENFKKQYCLLGPPYFYYVHKFALFHTVLFWFMPQLKISPTEEIHSSFQLLPKSYVSVDIAYSYRRKWEFLRQSLHYYTINIVNESNIIQNQIRSPIKSCLAFQILKKWQF